MDKQSDATFTARDMEDARAQGVLAGEVRVLKWGAGLALAAILGALGLLYQNQLVLQERVVRVEEHVVRVEEARRARGRAARARGGAARARGRAARCHREAARHDLGATADADRESERLAVAGRTPRP